MLVIGGILSVGSAILRSHKSGVNPVVEIVKGNEQLLWAQQEYLDQILLSTTQLGVQLGDIQQQIFAVGEHIDKQLAHTQSKEATDKYLAAIDTLKEDAQLKLNTGASPTVPGAFRISAVDLARNELLRAGPLYSLPALLTGWQIEIAYRKALGHENALVLGVDSNYRQHIRQIREELAELYALTLAQTQTFHGTVKNAILEYEEHRRVLWPYYGERLSSSALSTNSGIVCSCLAGANCGDSANGVGVQWVYPGNAAGRIGSFLHYGVLPLMLHYCYGEYSFDSSGQTDGVKFHIARVSAEVVELPAKDDGLRRWVRSSPSDIASAIKYEEAKNMTLLLASYMRAASLALLTPEEQNYEYHIDTVGESDWAIRYLVRDESLDALLQRSAGELLELGLDRVILASAEYPLAYELLQKAGVVTANPNEDWEGILKNGSLRRHRKLLVLPSICGRLGAADCLSGLVQQATWWMKQGINATSVKYRWRCHDLSANRIGASPTRVDVSEDKVPCAEWVGEYLHYSSGQERDKIMRQRKRREREPTNVLVGN